MPQDRPSSIEGILRPAPAGWAACARGRRSLSKWWASSDDEQRARRYRAARTHEDDSIEVDPALAGGHALELARATTPMRAYLGANVRSLFSFLLMQTAGARGASRLSGRRGYHEGGRLAGPQIGSAIRLWAFWCLYGQRHLMQARWASCRCCLSSRASLPPPCPAGGRLGAPELPRAPRSPARSRLAALTGTTFACTLRRRHRVILARPGKRAAATGMGALFCPSGHGRQPEACWDW